MTPTEFDRLQKGDTLTDDNLPNDKPLVVAMVLEDEICVHRDGWPVWIGRANAARYTRKVADFKATAAAKMNTGLLLSTEAPCTSE